MNYDDINRISSREILEYYKLYKSGKIEYYEKIVIASIPFVRYYINKYYSRVLNLREDINYDDLVEFGIIGVIKAVDSYNFSKKTNFYNYITYYIKGEVKRYLIKEKELISLDEINDNLAIQGKAIMSRFDLENNYLKKEILVVLQDVLNTLDPTTKNMILDYFGITEPKLNLADIALKYDISYANASRIIRIALYKLRLKMNSLGYYDRVK